MRFMFRSLVLAGLSTLAALAGDLTIEMNAKGKSAIGGGSSGKQVQYFSAKAHRMNNEGSQTDTMVDYGDMVTYIINHKKKTISKMSFDDAMAMMENANQQMPEGMAGMMNAMFGDPDNFKVEDLGTETVAGRTCKKHRITVGKMVMETSNDPTLKPPMPEVSYAKMLKAQGALSAAAGPSGKIFARLYSEMSKIKGIALKTHMTGFMGMDSSTEAVSVKEGAIPASVFALPEGYQMEDLGKKMKEQMAKRHH
jgi:hypothetical protein